MLKCGTVYTGYLKLDKGVLVLIFVADPADRKQCAFRISDFTCVCRLTLLGWWHVGFLLQLDEG